MLCLTSPTMKRWQPPAVSAAKILSCRALVSWYSSSIISAYRLPSSAARAVGVPSGRASRARASCSRSPKSSFRRSSLAAAYRLSNSRISAHSRSISGASFCWSSRYCVSPIRKTFVLSSVTASAARRRSRSTVSLVSASVHFFRGNCGKLASSIRVMAMSHSSCVTAVISRASISRSCMITGVTTSHSISSLLFPSRSMQSRSRSSAYCRVSAVRCRSSPLQMVSSSGVSVSAVMYSPAQSR